jgi:hypothetical protein
MKFITKKKKAKLFEIQRRPGRRRPGQYHVFGKMNYIVMIPAPDDPMMIMA